MKNSRAILVLLVLGFTSPCFAQNETHHHDAGEKLGTVSFPTSCAPLTSRQFERGVALLHSFEYEQASKQFQEIEKKDSHCAMAYWGQAMSLYHQLWERPSKDNLKLGGELLVNLINLILNLLHGRKARFKSLQLPLVIDRKIVALLA